MRKDEATCRVWLFAPQHAARFKTLPVSDLVLNNTPSDINSHF